jgi:DUF971 family protein
LEVAFNTGERFSYSAEYLRVESPAAGNQDARDARGRLKASRQLQLGAAAAEHLPNQKTAKPLRTDCAGGFW